jgi:hypothetical protein
MEFEYEKLLQAIGYVYRGSQSDAILANVGRRHGCVMQHAGRGTRHAPSVPAASPEPPPKKCALVWCNDRAVGGDSHCSDRCCGYDVDRQVIINRLEHFRAKMSARQHFKKSLDGLKSESTWAVQMASEELGKLERQWRALRVPAGH